MLNSVHGHQNVGEPIRFEVCNNCISSLLSRVYWECVTYVWSLGVKDEQLRTVRDVLSGLDTFVSLPTGYGKSLCYAFLPWAFDELRNTKKGCW